jgi:hypothetical protein
MRLVPSHSSRHIVLDELMRKMRGPTAAPLLPVKDVISAALSLFVPGPASVIDPDGTGVRLILRTLQKVGYKIVPMERADYEKEE